MLFIIILGEICLGNGNCIMMLLDFLFKILSFLSNEFWLIFLLNL